MKHFHSIEICILILYKIIIEFLFLPNYFLTYGYLFFFQNAGYEFSLEKWIISNIVFLFCMVFTFKTNNDEDETYLWFIRIILIMGIIPTLSSYAFISNIKWDLIIYPFIFYVIIMCLLKRSSRRTKYAYSKVKVPKIININMILLIICGAIILGIWVVMGHPIITSFDDAVEQRLSLRAEAMPKILGYIHIFIGGAVFPYLFAIFCEKKKYIYAVLSLILEYLAFSINGMKTWLVLYALYIVLVIIKKIDKNNFQKSCLLIEIAFIGLIVGSTVIYTSFNNTSFLAQIGRALIVPPAIGYKSIEFFKTNPLLYLRESIFRFFASSPYVNGSDFFIYYGSNSTITSARSNCGLWGDAYKNFGMIGVILYPFLYKIVFDSVIFNGKNLSRTLKYFILTLVFWNGINISYFTWLVSGGVLVMIVLEKIEISNMNYLDEIDD